MKTFPSVCTCKTCECAIYTYEDTGVCKACSQGNHLSGATRKIYDEKSSEIST